MHTQQHLQAQGIIFTLFCCLLKRRAHAITRNTPRPSFSFFLEPIHTFSISASTHTHTHITPSLVHGLPSHESKSRMHNQAHQMPILPVSQFHHPCPLVGKFTFWQPFGADYQHAWCYFFKLLWAWNILEANVELIPVNQIYIKSKYIVFKGASPTQFEVGGLCACIYLEVCLLLASD